MSYTIDTTYALDESIKRGHKARAAELRARGATFKNHNEKSRSAKKSAAKTPAKKSAAKKTVAKKAAKKSPAKKTAKKS